jgi:cytochrome c-type biogenesis protein CcmH
MKRNSILVILLILAAAAIQTITVFAQEKGTGTISDDEVNAIAKQLYCPVCENIPLDVCGTQACAQWRELIREKLAQGWNEEEIKEYFVLQYGDRVLAEPPREGLNWLVYIIPPLAFLAGVFILFRGIQSWRQIEPPEEDEAIEDTEPLDDYVARLEEELRDKDG